MPDSLFWILFIVLVVSSCTLSWLAWTPQPPRILLTVWGTGLAAAGYFALAIATYGLSGPRAVFHVMVTVIFILPYFARCIGVWYDAARRRLYGFDRMKEVLTYDLAEKAEREGKLDEAVRLYRGMYIPRDPEDPVARFRLAEVLAKQGRRPEAAAAFKDAVARYTDSENALLAAFRATDMAPDGDLPYLVSLRPRFEDARHRDLLEKRIQRLRTA